MLNGFYPNGLPVAKKPEFVEKYGKFLPKLNLSDVILQSGGKIIFHTEQEATDYISYIRCEINENSTRYEQARPESTNELLQLVDTFRVVKAK